MNKYIKDKIEFRILFVIIIIGLGLRIYGISYGLPSISHEEFSTLGNVWEKFNKGSLNPSWFSWPSLLFYIEYVFLKILRLFGSYDWRIFVLISRYFQVSIGTLTIPLVYFITCKLFNNTSALTASFLTAIFPQHIIYSQLARPEVIVPFFYLLVIYFSLYIIESGRLRYFITASIFVGLAIATKYNGIFSAPIPVLAYAFHLKKSKKNKISLFYLCVLFFLPVLIFLITNPYSILDYLTFKGGIVYQAARINFDINEQFPKTMIVFKDSLGGILFGISLYGLLNYVNKSSSNTFILTSFLSSLLLIIMWNPSTRLLLTSMLILIIISANTMNIINTRINSLMPTNRHYSILYLLIIMVSIGFTSRIKIYFNELSRKSVTDPVVDWLYKEAAPRSYIFWGFEAPVPYFTEGGKERYKTTGDIEPSIFFKNNYQDFIEERYDYVILTEQHNSLSPKKQTEQYIFYENLRHDYSVEIINWDRNDNKTYSAPFSQFFRTQKDYVNGSVYIYKKNPDR